MDCVCLLHLYSLPNSLTEKLMSRIFLWEAFGLRSCLGSQKVHFWLPTAPAESGTVLYRACHWTRYIRIQQNNGWELWIYPEVLNTEKITYTCCGAFVCMCGHTRTFVSSYIYNKPASTPKTKQHDLETHLDFFPSLQPATGNFLFPLSMPRSSGFSSAIWARPGAWFAVPTGWSSDHWAVEVMQYLNHFMSDIQDNTSNCFTVAYKGKQTNVDDYCFFYCNHRLKQYTNMGLRHIDTSS